MGQLVGSQVMPAQGVTSYINTQLANNYDDVLDVVITEHGQVLIIFKAQAGGAIPPPTAPVYTSPQ